MERTRFWWSPVLGGMEMMVICSTVHAFPRHFHNTYVIQVVEEGRDIFECAGRQYQAEKNQIVLINPGEAHTGTSTDSAPLTYRSFYPTVLTMRNLSSDLGGSKLPWFSRTVVDDPESALGLIHAQKALFEDSGSAQGEACLAESLVKLIKRFAVAPQQKNEARDTWVIERAKAFIREHHFESLSLDQIAHECGYSPFHLSRMFLRVAGVAPYEYMMAVRIEEAKRLIRSGHKLGEVAAEVGFADQAHLTRYFKKLVGAPPGEFSRSARSGKSCQESDQ